jgi:hypothetical protein
MDNVSINYLHVPSLTVKADNGRALEVYFEVMNAALLNRSDTVVYAIYRGSKKDDSIFNHLSIPGEIGDNIPGLDNINLKDYLGEINLAGSDGWEYEGDKLSKAEQQQIANHLRVSNN